MGKQIIKQPNGKYALFSSNTDTFIMLDATEKDIKHYFIEIEVRRISNRVQQIVKDLDSPGAKPYYQFTMSWDEAVEEHNSRVPENERIVASPKGDKGQKERHG